MTRDRLELSVVGVEGHFEGLCVLELAAIVVLHMVEIEISAAGQV